MKILQVPAKLFEGFTVGELREIIEVQQQEAIQRVQEAERQRPKMDVTRGGDLLWMDEIHIIEDDVSQDKPSGGLLNLNWRSEVENYGNSKWVRVESVVDSGASCPVAPPTMMPNVKVVPSEGSRRGQKWSSASKHKIDNMGEQHLRAVTDEGDETEVIFQIVDVSMPLVFSHL